MALEEAASRYGLKLKPKKNLTHKTLLKVNLLTHKLTKRRNKASRRRNVKKYNRANLKSLITFLEKIEELDEKALMENLDEFRDRLILFITSVLNDIHDEFKILQDMLPAAEMNEENASLNDLDNLIGALGTMRIAPDDFDPSDAMDKAKDVLENLLDEYESDDIEEEAREIYGTAIDMIVDAFIKAIGKHAVELKVVTASAAAAPENNLANAFAKLGF